MAAGEEVLSIESGRRERESGVNKVLLGGRRKRRRKGWRRVMLL